MQLDKRGKGRDKGGTGQDKAGTGRIGVTRARIRVARAAKGQIRPARGGDSVGKEGREGYLVVDKALVAYGGHNVVAVAW